MSAIYLCYMPVICPQYARNSLPLRRIKDAVGYFATSKSSDSKTFWEFESVVPAQSPRAVSQGLL
jgi:hypothetical protein